MNQAKDIRGNDVDEVVIGDSSRRDARGARDANDLQSEIGALRAAKEEIVVTRNRNIERITKINAELSDTLPHDRFQNLSKKRAELVADNTALDSRIREINERIRPLRSDMFGMEHGSTAMALAELRREIMELQRQVREMVAIVRRL